MVAMAGGAWWVYQFQLQQQQRIAGLERQLSLAGNASLTVSDSLNNNALTIAELKKNNTTVNKELARAFARDR